MSDLTIQPPPANFAGRMWDAFGEWLFAFLLAVGLSVLAYHSGRLVERGEAPAPPAIEHSGAVVRYLDVVIKDSDTKGRRQRFTCYPNQ